MTGMDQTATGWVNAYAGDPRMEGIRVSVSRTEGGIIASRVHPEDADALTRWSEAERTAMLSNVAAAVEDGSADVYDEDGREVVI